MDAGVPWLEQLFFFVTDKDMLEVMMIGDV